MTTAHRLVVLAVVLLVLAGVAGAVSVPRDQPETTDPPVRVFVGETLDVSAVVLTGGGTVGSGPVTLVGVAGDADGTTEHVSDPTNADFGGFLPGAYDTRADDDDRPEFSVVEPRVTRVVVRNQNDANVTNGWEPTGASLTVTAEYNFDAADRLDLTVESPDGVEVTDAVASDTRITTSGGSVTLDLSDEPEGTFRLTLAGSELEDATRTVTVRTGPRNTATPLPERTPTTEPPSTPTTEPTSSLTTEPTSSPTTEPTPTATPTPTAPSTQTPTPTETPAPTTSASTPGFGVAVTLAALVAAALVVRRRE